MPTVGNIRKLSQHLVNKIAAGEVIERPASVVKELVENALDAGATRVQIDIAEGGRKLIRVTDNGRGMSREDAELAFAQHATSKIAAEDDLFNIETMGFRGEALASIASISHAHIRTRQADGPEGWELSAAGQDIHSPTPCAGAVGTTVTIRDLFFNTPARRKFLRTTNTEFGHVTEQINRLALPHPDVAFVLRHNDRETLNLPPAGTTRQRVAELFGDELAGALLAVPSRGGAPAVEGLIAPPAVSRSSAKWQYVFLNGRFIRDRLISHALREAYRGLLAPVKYPVLFLFLRIDPAEVDVNVHPTKIEVRFRDSNRVYGEVLSSLRETLNRADLARDAEADGYEGTGQPEESSRATDLPATPATSETVSSSADRREESLREAMADFFRSAPPPQPRLSFAERQESTAPVMSRRSDASTGGLRLPLTPPRREDSNMQSPQRSTEQVPPRAVGQAHDSYILAETADGVAIIDQHALHERILFNDLSRRLAGGRLTGQKLLVPESLEVTDEEIALLDNHADLLGQLGIEGGSFGPRSWALQQYPTLLAERGVEAGAFLREVLDALGEEEHLEAEKIIERVLATMACKAAVKAGDPLRLEEMQELLASAEGIPKSAACPHGRPTSLKLTLHDLSRQFERSGGQ